MAANTRTEKKTNGGPFTFIKSRGSIRKELKRQHSNDEASSTPGALGRWLRELRPAASKPPAQPPPELDRTHPVYHSEGKGLRRRKDRDKRRHSFNEQQPGLTIPPAKHAGKYRSDGQGASSACGRQMAREVAPPRDVMMAAHSNHTATHQNHHTQPALSQGHTIQVQAALSGSKGASIYSYLQTQSGLNFAPVVHQQQQQQWSRHDAGSPPPTPPVRDASSLKGVNYGPGHEKFPSWPMSTATEVSPPGGGSHRSKSWTDHTNYPKETGITYTRPYMKRPNPSFTQQQLKTVMERCEKIPPETYESRCSESRVFYLPRVDREGKPLGDTDYLAPSPPERDGAASIKAAPRLTRADLEEYSRSYEDPARPPHPHQPPYAQSEGYHSYVSSADSTLATPFLDRLRRDSEARPGTAWEEDGAGRDSVVTTASSGSASSGDTLKWHGSAGDVSVAGRGLVAHSARVQTPQRHDSESVLFPAGGGNAGGWQSRVQRNNHHNNKQLRLFPVNTYTVRPPETPASPPPPTVAERVGELERQNAATRYTYLDPDKRHRVSDPTLKAIQKKALLSFYERHHTTRGQGAWRSEPQLARTLAPCPPQPPPRPRSNRASRRASSASDYAGGRGAERAAPPPEAGTLKDGPRHQHSNSCGSLSADLLGPLIVGPTISLDDWVPERPPKKPHLRSAFPPPDRAISPDLPPPSPPPVLEDEVFASDEPLPPPPPEVDSDWSRANVERLRERRPSVRTSLEPAGPKRSDRKTPPPRRRPSQNGVDHVLNGNCSDAPPASTSPPKSTAHSPNKCPPSPKRSPTSPNPTFARTLSMRRPDGVKADCGVPPMNLVDKNWSALKYHTQKLMVNGKIATSFPVRDGAERHGNDSSVPRPVEARLRRITPETQRSRSPPHSTATRLVDRSAHERISPPRFSTESHSTGTQRFEGASPPRLNSEPHSTGTQRFEGASPPRLSTEPHSTGTQRFEGASPPRLSTEPHSIANQCLEGAIPPRLKTEPNSTVIHRFEGVSQPRLSTEPHSTTTQRLEGASPPRLSTEPGDTTGQPAVGEDELSTSKASYLAYRRDRDVPNFEGSYKRTMSPSEGGLDNHKQTDCDRLPSTASEKVPVISPSHAVIDKEDSEVVQRVTETNNKQCFQVESVCLKNDEVKISCAEVEETLNESVTSVLTPLRGVEIQTQCDIVNENVPSSPRSPVFESLTLVQRSEVVLHVNAATSDASSQTELEETEAETTINVLPSSQVRQKLQEEIECERLSLDLASQLSPSDKLQGILVPGPEHRRPADYVAGLFRLEIAARPTRGSSVSTETRSPTSSSDEGRSERDLAESNAKTGRSEMLGNSAELQQKKEELMSRLARKLEVLRDEHVMVSEESRVNEELGGTVAAQVASLARPHEAAKYRLHVEEVGKITSLLLGLSGRLARAENALVGMPELHSERKILESKRDKLQEQLEEAKKLKENIDRRSVFVSNILYKYFNSEEYADYDHFINMKAKLIMESREIIDKIKLGEEQLVALRETLSSPDS